MNFQYLGAVINGSNAIDEEINKRIIMGNRAYFANGKLIK